MNTSALISLDMFPPYKLVLKKTPNFTSMTYPFLEQVATEYRENEHIVKMQNEVCCKNNITLQNSSNAR